MVKPLARPLTEDQVDDLVEKMEWIEDQIHLRGEWAGSTLTTKRKASLKKQLDKMNLRLDRHEAAELAKARAPRKKKSSKRRKRRSSSRRRSAARRRPVKPLTDKQLDKIDDKIEEIEEELYLSRPGKGGKGYGARGLSRDEEQDLRKQLKTLKTKLARHEAAVSK